MFPNWFVIINPFGIHLVNKPLERFLFGEGGKRRKLVNKQLQLANESKLNSAQSHLASFNIQTNQNCASQEADWDDTKFQLPKLKGPDVETHFFEIAQEYVNPYLRLVEKFTDIKAKWPTAPQIWRQDVAGWTRYNDDGSFCTVEAPLEDCFAFDVEVCVKEGHNPVMATALSEKAWYSWISPHLLENTIPPRNELKPSDLIKVEKDPQSERLIIGHNVSYDRARCADQYKLQPSKTRFIDTMSLHIAVSGMTSGQRTVKAMKQGIPVEKSDDMIVY